jgi:hypothetical protein
MDGTIRPLPLLKQQESRRVLSSGLNLFKVRHLDEFLRIVIQRNPPSRWVFLQSLYLFPQSRQ